MLLGRGKMGTWVSWRWKGRRDVRTMRRGRVFDNYDWQHTSVLYLLNCQIKSS
jgi:hypothetical protein